MSTPVRVVAFLTALVVAFLGARVVGSAVGPLEAETPVAHDGGGHGAGHDDGAGAEAAGHLPGGLQVSDQGYTLRLSGQPRQGEGRLVRFHVTGPDGEPVTAYDEVHEKQLHLIVVRRDLAGYQHVHPTMAPDGTWTARLDLAPGTTRLLADFTPTGGPELVLGTDVDVAGGFRPAGSPAVTEVVRVGDYRVSLRGDLVPGESSPVTAVVTRDGRPVTDLQPYLGAYGHLVALREGDLAYLHVHPEESGAGPEIPFLAEVPSEGRYRLYLDFRHRETVRTAAFVLDTDPDAGTGAATGGSSHGSGEPAGEEGDHDH